MFNVHEVFERLVLERWAKRLAHSRRYGVVLVGLDPQTKLQAPKLKYETL